jgi:hypothetical protein
VELGETEGSQLIARLRRRASSDNAPSITSSCHGDPPARWTALQPLLGLLAGGAG